MLSTDHDNKSALFSTPSKKEVKKTRATSEETKIKEQDRYKLLAQELSFRNSDHWANISYNVYHSFNNDTLSLQTNNSSLH
jgi:hypothetical protein